MKRMLLFGAALLLTAHQGTAQDADAFVSTWELASVEARPESSEWSPWNSPMGGETVGIIMYDDVGNMAVQITSSPRDTVTPAEQPEILYGYVAYYGRYEVDSVAKTVTHHRRNHLNPDIGALSVVRYFEFKGDTLTLTLAPQRTLRLKWVRAR